MESSEKTYRDKALHKQTVRPTIVAICGKSASGKDWLLNQLVTRFGWQRMVSWTTRPAREGEVEGKDYHFCGRDAFQEQIEKGAFLEWSEFRGWYYGTPLSDLSPHINIGVFNMDGMRALMNKQDEITVVPIFMECAAITRLARSIKREKKVTLEMFRRMFTDARDFSARAVLDVTNASRVRPIYLTPETVDSCWKHVFLYVDDFAQLSETLVKVE